MTTAPAAPSADPTRSQASPSPTAPTFGGRARDRAARRHVVVVGAGLAGLAAAAELSTHGFRVTVIDKNEHAGGKMNVLEEGGFTFDMGPTIITLPQVLRGICERSGRDPKAYIDLVDLDPQWRCFYEDGTVIDLRKDVRTFAEALDRQFPEARPGEGYQKFIDWSRRMFRLSEGVFFYKDLGGIEDMMARPPKEPGILGDVARMRLHATVGSTVHKFIKEPHLAQLCEHFLQYVGSSPFLSPAILGLIAAAQVDHGCWYPMGGTRMVARTVQRIAEEQGVRFVLGRGVAKILNDGMAVTGVELEDGERIAADFVVSNCDVQRTHRELLGGWMNSARPKALQEAEAIGRKYKPACSGVVLYLGLDRQYEHLAHHNFLFSGDSQEEFGDIYERGIPARDPTLYLAVPSRTDPGQAPEGGEALYILVHTAYRRDGHDWETGGDADPSSGPARPREAGPMLREYRRVILDKLKRFGMEDVEEHIQVDRFLTPDSIDRMYNAEGGAIYGLASHGRLAGGFKPRNRSRVLANLYLAGGSANPGPGVPMVLMSGVTAARCVAEDAGVTPIGEPGAAEPAGV